MTDHGVLVHPALFEQYFVYLMILELCTFSSLMLSYALFQRLLTSKRIFHPNLTTILLFQPIFLIIATFIRQFRHILQVINLINGFSFQICSFFSEALAAVCLNMTSSYAIERYIAMRNLENYENKYPNNHIGLKIILGTLTLLVFDLIVFYTSLLPGWLAYGISYVVQIVGIFRFGRRDIRQSMRDNYPNVVDHFLGADDEIKIESYVQAEGETSRTYTSKRLRRAAHLQ
ncbi:unnamed protein product, partial [Mesorhabditis belari]|uniref:Uncharacterized protein n=1 Tax=Mesorhabditis belari TaxID=2138241 RepID=A0AAF3FNH3_9BILA